MIICFFSGSSFLPDNTVIVYTVGTSQLSGPRGPPVGQSVSACRKSASQKLCQYPAVKPIDPSVWETRSDLWDCTLLFEGMMLEHHWASLMKTNDKKNPHTTSTLGPVLRWEQWPIVGFKCTCPKNNCTNHRQCSFRHCWLKMQQTNMKLTNLNRHNIKPQNLGSKRQTHRQCSERRNIRGFWSKTTRQWNSRALPGPSHQLKCECCWEWYEGTWLVQSPSFRLLQFTRGPDSRGSPCLRVIQFVFLFPHVQTQFVTHTQHGSLDFGIILSVSFQLQLFIDHCWFQCIAYLCICVCVSVKWIWNSDNIFEDTSQEWNRLRHIHTHPHAHTNKNRVLWNCFIEECSLLLAEWPVVTVASTHQQSQPIEVNCLHTQVEDGKFSNLILFLPLMTFDIGKTDGMSELNKYRILPDMCLLSRNGHTRCPDWQVFCREAAAGGR